MKGRQEAERQCRGQCKGKGHRWDLNLDNRISAIGLIDGQRVNEIIEMMKSENPAYRFQCE